MIDVAALLAEVAADSPAGPDLGYDPEFVALEQAARGRPEQQFGANALLAAEPNWSEVRDRAVRLLVRTKDLRAALLLTRALTYLDDFAGLASGLRLIYGLLDRYWDTVHPGLDPDDNHDPTMRLNALLSLSDADSVLRDVRNLYLVRPGRHGALTIRNILTSLGKWSASAGELALSRAEVDNLLRAANADGALPVDALRESAHTVDILRALLIEKVGIDRAPELQPLQTLLSNTLQVCDAALGVAENTAQTEEHSVVGITDAIPHVSGAIHSREDAVRMLQQVVDFVERTEPANPAPLFIRRAQRLMVKNFVEIIQELVPESLSQIQKMAGLEKE